MQRDLSGPWCAPEFEMSHDIARILGVFSVHETLELGATDLPTWAIALRINDRSALDGRIRVWPLTGRTE
jgi:hypothetical protein